MSPKFAGYKAHRDASASLPRARQPAAAISPRPRNSARFFENKVGPYRTLVKLLTKEGKNFEALLYAERAKTHVLVEAG